ncbi:MAG: DUF2207 domain-containing protein [Bacilli bacterium]|nr:DUF2207 domain-containing protein [Bacilli bacterium]MDD4282277.1 DUF2207 domain-containing protein [Bacilli bacterium]MDD4718423.1 DUF2207 domain-containing protein [Bacilli bacterium]
MKKILKTLFFIMIFLPFTVKANNYGISNYYIETTVIGNGDLLVKELFVLEGEFNGYERIINYRNPNANKYDSSDIYNGSGVELVQIKAIEIDNNVNFEYLYKDGDQFTEATSSSNGIYGQYTVTNDQNGLRYKIYNPSSAGKKGFYIEYIMKDLAILHNDVSEIGWNLFSNEQTESIENLEMIVNIPNNQEELRVWGHGPFNGETDILSQTKLIYKVAYLNAHTPIDIRFVFDKVVLENPSKKTDINALSQILEDEKQRAEAANKERELQSSLDGEQDGWNEGYHDGYNNYDYNEFPKNINRYGDDYFEIYKKNYIENYKISYEVGKEEGNKQRNISYVVDTIKISWLVGLGYIIYNIYHKHDKEHQTTFKTKYYRDFPGNYGASNVGYLINKKIGTKEISATILDLIVRKHIKYQQLTKKEYQLIYTPNVGVDQLTKAEEELIKMLFQTIGSNDAVTIKKINNYAKKNYQSFLDKYNDWKDEATIEAEDKNFYEEKGSIKLKAMTYSIIGLLFTFLLIEYSNYPFINLIVIITSFCSLIYFATITKRTKEGQEQYLKWMGLNRFLKDFGKFKTRELPQIELWEKYLVYAVVFGSAKKLAKDMEIKFVEMSDNGYTSGDYLFDISYLRIINNLNSSINQGITSAVNTAISTKAISESRSSSSGGFGGGFSGGGGSFGGGGGGGRF